MYEAAQHNLSLYSFSCKTMQDSKYSYIMQSAPPKLLLPSTHIMLISMYDTMDHDILYIGMISKCYSLRTTTESILVQGSIWLMLSMMYAKMSNCIVISINDLNSMDFSKFHFKIMK